LRYSSDRSQGLATETHPHCGTISLGAERISYIIACTQGGKANLPRNKKEFPNLEIFGVERLQEAVQLARDLAEG